jgi:single-stranded-DNA-specific exonuclease RecJ
MNLQPKLIELLNKRGIESDEDIREFLSDKPQRTYDPFLLLNMEAGVDLILSAIEEEKRICIYGDYDADGITSTVILMEVLSNLTENLTYYIPSRFDEGYGLNCKAIDTIKKDGTDLIVTVDCGSVSCDEVEYAKSLGMEVLVTDHHTVTDKVADCLVINPTQKECQYPFKYLAGCGVAFKLAQAIVVTMGLPKSVLTRTLDMVGIGTIGDIVPLIDENRTLAKYGLRAINTSARENLDLLIEGIGLHPGEISTENVSYVIVPHLNAAGRMKHASIAVELFLADDAEMARKNVAILAECNSERKRIQADIFDACVDIVEKEYMDDDLLLIDLQGAHEGITGIVAGKLKEKYYRPAIIVTPTGDGCLKGTGRSIDGVNIFNLLKENEELFDRFGGHAAACGFTMKKENLPALRENLRKGMSRIREMDPSLFENKICAELELGAGDVSLDLVDQLEMLEPCGCANARPLVSFEAWAGDLAKMGNKGQYSRFTATMDDYKRVPCVVFREAAEADAAINASTDGKVNIIGSLSGRTWNGNRTLQMTVENIELV